MRKTLAAMLAAAAAPALAQTAPLAPIEQSALSRDAFATGLLDRAGGALPPDLWRGARAATLTTLLEAAPARPSGPGVGAALRRVLLSSGDAPADVTPALGGAKLRALANAGLTEEARSIESLSVNANNDPASQEAMAIADILSGDLDRACGIGRRSNAGLEYPFWVKLRVVCYASSNELDAAGLALGILRENGRLSETDDALLTPLTIGAKLKAPIAPVDAVHYAAIKMLKAPVSAGALQQSDAGVVEAIARDAALDWPTRLAAATQAAASGAMGADELRTLYTAVPAEAAGAFKTIAAMTAPELLRDRAALIAAEIAAASDFESLYATSLLYSGDIRASEGTLLPPGEAISFALASLAVGDAVGAERWLAAAAPSVLGGSPEEATMRFIDLAGILGALEPAGAARIAKAANIDAAPARLPPKPAQPTDPALAPIVAAAIDAAANGAKGQAALAAIAAADAAAAGDEIAEAVLVSSLAVAGMDDVVRRRAVENAIRALYPTIETDAAVILPAASSVPESLRPRIKPKRST